MTTSIAASPANGSLLKRSLLHGMPPTALQLLRGARIGCLRALDPVDYASRIINNQRRLPPFHLRREVGDPSIFESSGAEFLAYAKLLGGLKSNERVLDIGCGCGLMALFLEHYLEDSGAYLGVDHQRGAIRWCRANIRSRAPNFDFVHLDIRNQRYNPRGAADALRIPAEDGTIDFVIVKSVFTHMLQSDLEQYMSEISRVLSRTGRCLASWFLYCPPNPRTAPGSGGLTFKCGDGVCRFESEHSPETAVAYAEPYVRRLLDRHGLRLREDVYRGAWSGRAGGLSTQDLTIIERLP